MLPLYPELYLLSESLGILGMSGKSYTHANTEGSTRQLNSGTYQHNEVDNHCLSAWGNIDAVLLLRF